MKKILPKILFFYSALASILITVSIVFTSSSLAPVIFATFFLPVTAYFIIEFFKQMRGEGSDMGPGPKKGEVITTIIIFLLLIGLGLRNIYINKKLTIITPRDNNPQLTTSPPPLVFKTQPSPTPTATLTVSITDGSVSVNIREKPTIYSERVAEAKDGDVFEYMEKQSGWYKIKLADGSFGFISLKYIKETPIK